MPVIGDICSGRKLGYGGGRWVWLACVDCGREHWVQITRSSLREYRCRSCATRHFLAVHPEHGRGVNHPMWGKTHSVGSITKMRIAHSGKSPTQETRDKMRASSLGNKYALGFVQSPETIAKRAASRRGYRHSPETIAKIRESNDKNRKPISNETRERLRVSHLGHIHSMEQIYKIAESNRGKKVSKESVERIREAVRLTWATYSDADKNKRVATLLSAATSRPNKVETTLLLLLWSVSLDWTYIGDGSFLVGGKSPDYWNGDHKLIELFGDFWHRGDNPEERIDFFARFGYSCLVIWEHEVYAGIDAVKQRVVDFLGDKK